MNARDGKTRRKWVINLLHIIMYTNIQHHLHIKALWFNFSFFLYIFQFDSASHAHRRSHAVPLDLRLQCWCVHAISIAIVSNSYRRTYMSSFYTITIIINFLFIISICDFRNKLSIDGIEMRKRLIHFYLFSQHHYYLLPLRGLEAIQSAKWVNEPVPVSDVAHAMILSTDRTAWECH